MRKDGKAPSKQEMFVLTHTRKDGTPINNASRDIMVRSFGLFWFLFLKMVLEI